MTYTIEEVEAKHIAKNDVIALTGKVSKSSKTEIHITEDLVLYRVEQIFEETIQPTQGKMTCFVLRKITPDYDLEMRKYNTENKIKKVTKYKLD